MTCKAVIKTTGKTLEDKIKEGNRLTCCAKEIEILVMVAWENLIDKVTF